MLCPVSSLLECLKWGVPEDSPWTSAPTENFSPWCSVRKSVSCFLRQHASRPVPRRYDYGGPFLIPNWPFKVRLRSSKRHSRIEYPCDFSSLWLIRISFTLKSFFLKVSRVKDVTKVRNPFLTSEHKLWTVDTGGRTVDDTKCSFRPTVLANKYEWALTFKNKQYGGHSFGQTKGIQNERNFVLVSLPSFVQKPS